MLPAAPKTQCPVFPSLSFFFRRLLIRLSFFCLLSSPKNIQAILGQIHEDVLSRYYGCGLCIPGLLEGCKVLDLGCGAGRDCFLCQKLVGEEGEVVGVDMTQEQLEVADRYRQFHMEVFGFKTQNVTFKKVFLVL